MAYDYRSWVAAGRPERKRHRWAPWLIGFGIACAGVLAGVAVLDPGGRPFGPSVVAAFSTPILFCAFSPFARETWLTARGLSTFDEFERDALCRASQRAYATLLLLLVLLFLWWSLASAAGWPSPVGPRALATLGFAVGGIGAALPVLFAELLIPFPPADDPEENLL